MKMVIPNEGKLKWLEWAVVAEGGVSEFWRIRLFTNNLTPNDATVAADFVEADFVGYDPVLVLRSDFSLPTTAGNVAEVVASFVPTYECTGGAAQTVYGWWMLGSEYDVCYATQRFDAPRVMAPGTVEILDPFKLRLKTFT